MPVLPLVGSSTVQPGRSRPSFSASATIAERRPVLDRTGRVVRPRASPRAARPGTATGAAARPAGCGRPSRAASRSASPGGQPPATAGRMVTTSPSESGVSSAAEEADVLVVDVDVDEAVQLAVVVDEPGPRGPGAGCRGREAARRACRPSPRRPSPRRCRCGGSSGSGPRSPCCGFSCRAVHVCTFSNVAASYR